MVFQGWMFIEASVHHFSAGCWFLKTIPRNHHKV